MPTSPLGGLSTLFHIGVIVFHKLFGWIPKSKVHIAKKEKGARFNHTVSLMIIFVVFSFVITTAFILVHASIFDSHSSILVVDNYLTGTVMVDNTLPAPAPIHDTTMNQVANTVSSAQPEQILYTPLEISLPRECLAVFNSVASSYSGSVVDYLATRNQNSSFAARQSFANQAGISKYSGSYEQNQLLLMKLFLKDLRIPQASAASCRI